MNCICFNAGSVNLIFRAYLIFSILFEGKTASQTDPKLLKHSTLALNDERSVAFNTTNDESRVITLKKKTIITFTYNDITTMSFVLVQAHTQYKNLSLSNRHGTEQNINSDTAILKTVSYHWQPSFSNEAAFHTINYVVKPPNATTVKALVAVVPFNRKAPIPGGCCLTCTLLIDPNLILTTKHFYKSYLSFHLANVYDYNTSDCSGRPTSKPAHYRLKYSIYQYFLEEGNLENDELFDGISKMLTPSKVKENGKKIRDWNPKVDVPYIVLDTKRGQGVVFNILLYDPMTNSESVYSPVATYGCSFTAKVDGCDSFGSIANLVLASCGCLFGLFICFFGVRCHRLYIIGAGLTLFSFIAFVLVANETGWSHDERIIASVCIGIAGALLVYLLWWSTGYRYLILYICGLPFGFLFTAVIFFTPFGNLHYWKNNVNFWTVFLSMSITIPFLFLLCLKVFVIVVSSFVGAYGFVVGIDTFLRSSMTYIILNIMMRATEDDFAKYDIPFQSKDYILTGVWAGLSILGLIVQSVMSKGKPVLPNEAPRKKRQRRARVRSPREIQVTRQPIDNEDERMPILINTRHDNISTFENDVDDERLPVLIETNSRSHRNDEREKYSTKYGTNVVC